MSHGHEPARTIPRPTEVIGSAMTLLDPAGPLTIAAGGIEVFVCRRLVIGRASRRASRPFSTGGGPRYHSFGHGRRKPTGSQARATGAAPARRDGDTFRLPLKRSEAA